MTAKRDPVQYFINGRFLRVSPTGVQRVAKELVRAIDIELSETDRPPENWTLLHPWDVENPLALNNIDVRMVRPLSGVLWEQFVLPWAARRGVLLNFANSAPIFHQRNVAMFHDAQVYAAPKSYSALFRYWYRYMQPRVAKRAVNIMTVSSFSAEQLRRHDVIGDREVTVVPNAVNHSVFADQEITSLANVNNMPLPASKKGFVAAFTSGADHKNISMLIDAFRSERLAEIGLALIGSELPRDTQIDGGRIRHLGRLSDREVRAVLRASLFLAFPSKTEGFGLPPLEAMAIGCPVISSNAGALPEVCGDAAVFVDPHDKNGWIEAIVALADDGDRRRRLAEKGRQQASRFTWRSSARRVLETLAPSPPLRSKAA